MVGKGVLIECLEDKKVENVLVIGRKSCGIQNEKLEEILHQDFTDYSSIKSQLAGYDACFFCLGISVVGLSEEQYTRITYDFAISAAEAIKEMNPELTFCYVSGQGTDSTEKGRTMWARVKGKTENHLLNLGFRKAYMFRPGYIQPMKGVRSKVWWYQLIYDVLGWVLYPIMKGLSPGSVTSSDRLGQAMIEIIQSGYEENILHNKDINKLAERHK